MTMQTRISEATQAQADMIPPFLLPSQQITGGEKVMNSKEENQSANGQQHTHQQPNADAKSGDVAAQKPIQTQATAEQLPRPQPIIRRENFCKFAQVEQALVGHLEAKTATKDAARELGISVPTFNKYKGLVSIKYNTLFTTPEEEAFLEKQRNQPLIVKSKSTTPQKPQEPHHENAK